MEFWGDERAVTVQIGAIFLLGFVVITLSIFQVTVVPQENEEVEFGHSQRVQEDMLELRSSVAAAGGGGSSPPTTVEVGTTYPPRSLFINPPPASGSLRTVDRGTLRIVNAEAEGDGEVRDYWNGNNQTFTSKAIVYEPNYNVYGSAPNTTVEGWVAYNRFDSGRALPISGQTLLQGRTITVVTINGSLAASQAGTVTVDPQAVSTSTRTVALNNSSSGNITLTVPSELSLSEWRDLLSNQPYNASVDAGPSAGTVNVTLEGDVTYNLRMAKVGVGTGVEDEPVHYLDDVRTLDGTVANDSSSQVTLEARDRYNNPVSGVQVAATATNLSGAGSPGGFPSSSDNPEFETTGADGRATFDYTAPSEAPGGGAEINLTYNIKDGEPYTTETVSQEVVVREFVSGRGAGGGGGGDGPGEGNTQDVNPGAPGTVILNAPNEIGNSASNVSITLKNNTDSDSLVEIQQARISFFFTGDPGNGNKNIIPYSADVGGLTTDKTELVIGADFKNLSDSSPNNEGGYIPLNPRPANSSDITTVYLEFEDDGGQSQEISNDDFYVLSIRLSNGDTYTYFISHP